jgi:hypothetical protein
MSALLYIEYKFFITETRKETCEEHGLWLERSSKQQRKGEL